MEALGGRHEGLNAEDETHWEKLGFANQAEQMRQDELAA